MIGVAVQENERAFAAEFFELFKTPWEFYRSGARYDVVLSTSDVVRCDGARLAIIFDGRFRAFDSASGIPVNTRAGGLIVTDEGRELPIYGDLATFPGSSSQLLREHSSQESVVYVVEKGYSGATTLRVGYDLFEEVHILLTAGQPVRYAGIPTLDEHISCLRNWITLAGIPLAEIPPVPDGYNLIACLTHDIDHPLLRSHWCDHTMLGFLYRATIGTLVSFIRGTRPLRSLLSNWKAACLLPFVHFGLARDFWSTFDRYLEIDEAEGSTFFVIPRKGHAGRTNNGVAPAIRASGYDLEEVHSQLRKIILAGSEVGVHGIDAWIDSAEGRSEMDRVVRAIARKDLGVRMHWLYFNECSPGLLEEAGFTYDSTVGFRETIGFRAGTGQVYRPPGVTRLMELPLHVMDTALFYPAYLDLDHKSAQGAVKSIVDDVERVGGVVTINWHDRSIAPERLWDEFYLGLVKELKNRRAWLPNAGTAVAWFRKRRSATVDAKWADAGTITVRGRVDEGDELPGMRLRVHKPRSRSLADPVESRVPAQFADIGFNGTTELNYAV